MTAHMRRITFHFIYIIFIANTLGVSAKTIPLDGYAAMVNEQVITVGEIFGMIQPVEWQLRETYSGRELEEKLAEAYENALNALIERALILEEYNSLEGNLPDRAVEDYLNGIIHERFEDDRNALLQALAEERMTYEEWRDEMRDRLVVSIMRRQEVTDQIAVSPSAVRAVYEERIDEYQQPEQVNVSVIVLNKGDTEEDQATKLKEAETILQRVKDGEDFAELARQFSEGTKASKGGNLGWLKPNSLRKELSDAVAGLNATDISDIIDTGNEYYIIMLEARKNAGVIPFESAKGEIEEELRQQEATRLYDAWIDRLKQKYYIKIFETD